MKNRAAGVLLAGLVAFLTAALTFVFLDRQSSPEIVIQAEAFPTIVARSLTPRTTALPLPDKEGIWPRRSI